MRGWLAARPGRGRADPGWADAAGERLRDATIISVLADDLAVLREHSSGEGTRCAAVSNSPPDLASGLGRSLRERAVVASIRGRSLRIAPHLHTTASDVDRLIDALAASM